MHVADSALVLSATDLSGYLACAHLTTQNVAVTRGSPRPPKFDDPGAAVLRQRGEEHEARLLDAYEAAGLRVSRLTKPVWPEPSKDGAGRTDSWRDYAQTTLEAMRSGVDVIHQACFFDGTWLGLPDFLIRVEGASSVGDWSYEVVDAKLSREAKAGSVLQICSYSEMLGAVQGHLPERMHLALGGLHGPDSDTTLGPAGVPLETFRFADYGAYFRSVKRRMLAAIADEPDTYPEPCAHCSVCAWAPVCKKRWRADDHLSLVAGISRRQRAPLEAQGIDTLTGLAEHPLPPDGQLEGVSDTAYTKIREQARIQLEGRTEGSYKYELLLNAEPDTGLLALPTPSEGDLFFDIEGDPHAFRYGLEYLLGYVDTDGAFTGLWALDPDEERRQFEAFIDTVVARREEWPDMHVFHYAPYEQTAIRRLAGRYGTREEEVDRLLRGRVFVDLYRVVRQGLRASVESYSIKKLEPLYDFERSIELRAAGSAMANFEAWLQLGRVEEGGSPQWGPKDGAAGDTLLHDIERYNEDDCVSTLRLRDWLETLRPELESLLRAQGLLDGGLPRLSAPEEEASEATQEENERVASLYATLTAGVSDDESERSEGEQARWLLAQLLSWHRREKKPVWWEYFRLRDLGSNELMLEKKPIAGMVYAGEAERVKRSIIHRYRFPHQDFGLRPGDKPHDPVTGKSAGEVWAVDPDACTIELKRGANSDVPHPCSLLPYDIVPDQTQRKRIQALAEEVVESGLDGAENRVGVGLLLRRPPALGERHRVALRGPNETTLEAAKRIALELEDSILPVQGPPGSGKTYIGARLIVELIRAGKRVGVTANSHKVIVNLLDEVCAAATEAGVPFSGLQKAEADRGCQDPRIRCEEESKKAEAIATGAAKDEDGEPVAIPHLVAGTVWLWARDGMQRSVDVLVVDEAGQMSLANALAASGAAHNMVLLGDPQQLDQPQQGVHPPGADAAVLEHLVSADTLEAHRGLFLDETWRLHPDVCAFTSELYYEGRLTSRLELATQQVLGPSPFDGAGLRFVPVTHSGNSSEAPEEVETIAAVVHTLFDSDPRWVDADGDEHPVRIDDVLVVAPYNAQVDALRAALPTGMRVGTVDKFQGQEAPIVIYSTASSSAEEAPRGMEFLFSPDRLNVATSRARCVVLLVGSPALLIPDCTSVRQMQLANGLCRFEEMAAS